MASAYWFKVKLPWDVCQLQKRHHLRCVIWGSGLVFSLWTWINSKLFVSNEHPGSLATTQKGFNLLQGFWVWHGKTSLIYGLQIVRDQISYSNHHVIWHNVTQNVPVNVYEQNVYTLNCSSHFSPSPGFRLLVESSDEEVERSRMKSDQTHATALIVLQLFVRNLRGRSTQSAHVPQGRV